MNIQTLTLKNFRNDIIRSNPNALNVNNASYPNFKPLDKDTISFKGKDKLLTDAANCSKAKIFECWDANALPFREIITITEDFKLPVSKFLKDLKYVMSNLVVTSSKPNNPIMPGATGIKGGVKAPQSLAVKANSRKLFTVEEVEKMGDVGRARIVLRSSAKEHIAMIFDALQGIVKKGYKINEIENYRYSPKYSYVTQDILDKFETFCQEYDQYPEIISKSIQSGYTALHFTIELPDKKLLELQIMSKDMENVKEIEDFFYKWRCGKEFAPKYKPIYELFKKHMPQLDDFQKETLKRYIHDSYMHTLALPAVSAKSRPTLKKDYFLPFPYSLPQELNFVNLHKMMEECNKAKMK